MRDAPGRAKKYDLDVVFDSAIRMKAQLRLFGGEPLLMPVGDLERVFAWSQQQKHRPSIQTNGSLITEEHITLFVKYGVSVGISIDGPGELNELRRHGNATRTLEATSRSLSAIERLVQLKRPPGLIVTLHRSNASPERADALVRWMRDLDAMGVRSARLHMLETESEEVRRNHALTDADLAAILLKLLRLERELVTLRFDIFSDMKAMLRGGRHARRLRLARVRSLYDFSSPGHRGRRYDYKLRPH